MGQSVKSGVKILVVDDETDMEPMIRQKFRRHIREKTYDFEFAFNGIEALEKIIEFPEISIVLSDINMPEMDGLTLLAKIKELNNPGLKTVIISAYGDMDNIRTAMNSGAFDFITKPVNFEDLEIWQDARELCKTIRGYTFREPFNRDFRFRDQINASSGSIMDNIAEGFERDGRKEFIQFLSISKGSCGETRSQSYLAFDANFINQEEFDDLLNRTQKINKKISNFMAYLKASPITGKKYK